MMNLAKLTIALLLLTTCENAFAQDDQWETYSAAYEKGPAITSVNMSLKGKVPVKGQGFLLITGVTFTPCENGLPSAEMLETLEPIDDALARQVSLLGKTTFVGTRTQNCQRLNYFYIQDSMDVRFSLQTFYKDNFPDYKTTISIRNDTAWKDYLEVLYPNEIIEEQIYASKLLLLLSDSGDKLQKERPIEYHMYFSDEKKRENFIDQVKKEGFNISKKGIDDSINKNYPWYVRVSKSAMPDKHTISGMVIYLRNKAATFGGKYGGWETILIKD